MIAKFVKAKTECIGIVSYYFKPDGALHYTAGQFIELTLDLPTESSDKRKRWFTLSSSPAEALLMITTRVNQEPLSDFKECLMKLEPGTEVMISDAMGDFVLPKDSQTPVVFIAAGIGITPYRSMVRSLAGRANFHNIKLIHAVRNLDEQLFGDIFSELAEKPMLIPSSPATDWGGLSGPMNVNMLSPIIDSYDNPLVYISGPEPLVEKLSNDLCKSGFNEQRIITDFFPGYINI